MLPVLFVSHGSPRLILEGGGWATALREEGAVLRREDVELVLVISAHWLTQGPCVECSEKHTTLHDFSGFDRELYNLNYPARGDPYLSNHIAEKLGARCTRGRGLDHGAWAVLWHLFPEANVPVTQLSIDVHRSLREHVQLAERLFALRESVLVLCSGGAVHNLMDALFRPYEPPQWAVSFKEKLKGCVLEKDLDSLISLIESREGKLAHPTQEHVVPLLYFMGLLSRDEKVDVLYDGFEFGSVSLLSFKSVI